MQLPHIPSDVPFTGEQKAWLAGFLAGLNTRIGLPSEPAPAAVAPPLLLVAAPPRSRRPPPGPWRPTRVRARC